jgi:hypothetical protein
VYSSLRILSKQPSRSEVTLARATQRGCTPHADEAPDLEAAMTRGSLGFSLAGHSWRVVRSLEPPLLEQFLSSNSKRPTSRTLPRLCVTLLLPANFSPLPVTHGPEVASNQTTHRDVAAAMFIGSFSFAFSLSLSLSLSVSLFPMQTARSRDRARARARARLLNFSIFPVRDLERNRITAREWLFR